MRLTCSRIARIIDGQSRPVPKYDIDAKSSPGTPSDQDSDQGNADEVMPGSAMRAVADLHELREATGFCNDTTRDTNNKEIKDCEWANEDLFSIISLPGYYRCLLREC